MPFFERPLVVGGSSASASNNVSLLVQPARKIQSFRELGILIKEGVKRNATTVGILPQEKVTRRDSGCGPFTPTGTLLKMVKNTISVDPVEIKMEECTTDFTESVLEAALKAGHAEDNNLEGTVIESIIRKALGGEALNAADASALEMAIEPVVGAQVTGVIYLDALRIFLLGDRTSLDPNYNQTDGIRKKMLAKNATPSSLSPTGVYRGAAMPTPAQLKATPALAVTALDDLYEGASDELQEQDTEQKAIYVDTDTYRALRKEYRKIVGSVVNSQDLKLVPIDGSNGQRFTYENIEVIELKTYGKWLKADFAGNAAATPVVPATNPTVAIYTVRENLVFATDLESDMAEIKFWYDINTEFNRTRVKYRIGAGFGYDILMAFAL